MSWKRILKLVLSKNMPVIVTDDQIEHSVVVLQFSEYERLMQIPNIVHKTLPPDDLQESLVSEIEHISEPVFSAQPEQKVDLDQIANSPQNQNGLSELEDRFYLEPLDEDGGQD